MGKHQYLACPTCGATRKDECFGIDEDGNFVGDEAPAHRFRRSVKTVGGGNKGISWTHEDVPPRLCHSLRQRMAAELDSLDAINAQEGDVALRCLACGE